MPTEKKRDSNIELFRIIMMLLIVAHHYVVNSGVLELIDKSAFGFKPVFLLVFGAWGKVGINGFVLITGYFMCKSRITAKKFLKLLGEVVFYKLLIYLVFVVFGIEQLGFGSFIRAVIPVLSVSYNFTGCFLIFYLLIPFVNLLILAMDQKKHLCLLIILFGAYTVLGSIPLYTSVTFNYVSWFVVIYLLGAYIRIYTHDSGNRYGIKFLLSGLAACLSIVGIAYLKDRLGLSAARYFFVNDSNKILAVLPAVYGFLFFKNLRIGYRKFINIIASASFGVLLIHTNSDAMRTWLWQTTLCNTSAFYQPWWFGHAILSVITVYTICTIIDLLRIYLIERPALKWYNLHGSSIVSSIGQKADRILEKLTK